MYEALSYYGHESNGFGESVLFGTHFTCVTGTHVQILTHAALLADSVLSVALLVQTYKR